MIARRTTLSIVALLCAASFVVCVNIAAFGSATSASARVPVFAPRLQMALLGPGSLDASGFVAGDRAERLVDLSNRSSAAFTQVMFRLRTPITGLTDGSARGLQVQLDRCSGPWRARGVVFTCPAIRTTIVGAQPVTWLDLNVHGLHSLLARGLDHLRITISLPRQATNRAQGVLARIRYYFSAIA